MSIQRRLLLYLLICAPLVWAIAFAISAAGARHEVNELFDTQLVSMARQAHLMASAQAWQRGDAGEAPPSPMLNGEGDADLQDLAVAVWDREGRAVLLDHEGAQLPWRSGAIGFDNLVLQGHAWRIYYLSIPQSGRMAAAGQKMHERDELVWGLVGGQLLPWLLVLPVLLVAMAWAVRVALQPMRELTDELTSRRADDLRPVSLERAPRELHPMLNAMNGLFTRVDDTLARERQFTADAAHELRTPIAVLAAQWDVYRGARNDAERQRAGGALDSGLRRMARLIDQLLGLSRLDATERLKAPQPLAWERVVEQAMTDVLPLAERRQIDLGCEWAEGGPSAAPPWLGDDHLMTLLLRNLLDNAVRYAPDGSAVTLSFGAQSLSVDNPAPPGLSASDMANWGERFHRPDGQPESGSGLGVSIAQRIATLHGLALRHRLSADGATVIAELSAR
ncbi:MAG: sensor histidine kinase N-terminal domain-containing protein [Hydrogenophaga sp.]|uniref:histidine kinase dimerization/phospho-acceptor domain-containing protein n=1 Tax=Hydrogenophaga sp. TaxID=1904254 RepID=UPI001DA8E1FC|nr:histidine kinase dimerization/phospho-acceptor domain-containing protein [Hydrogenophaga sp.]MBX3609642.1 sensor histidine kinase N-terminal domain-containing protein [Hydrogenophaga sp.]